jgi:hypothetical protein
MVMHFTTKRITYLKTNIDGLCCTTVTITTTGTGERLCVVVKIIAIFFSNQRLKQIKNEVKEKKKEVLIVFPIIFLKKKEMHTCQILLFFYLLQIFYELLYKDHYTHTEGRAFRYINFSLI